ncbi:D-alanyl-D-alanine carboxypeptidase family protein [Anaeromicropila herbilytica]|uniref:serine-type D-Ala-D-Ala carboxypeptidase n=1 Tax=Anaeromicropila herbilytica TaxID=2785025 RepID=A0A7R7ID99_9FIRM|nr:D-alanyl-D-alanine carboxypeptidase family protein [Anaeromicropila herbilytica]BCN31342.1 hypothetical protein bsdtb5_26370 [Anaeromicropila herbilytica]
MKLKFSTLIKILIILAIIAYGFYVYWINTDHSTKSADSNATEQTAINQNTTNQVAVDDTKNNKIINTLALDSKPVDDTNSSSADYIMEKLNLHAKAALLMDASNYRVLYEKNGYSEMPMASTTKIMTLIVTLENASLDDVVTVSKYAAGMPDVQLGIKAGEQYKLGDLVYSLMLESHNDVAVAIAEHVGGSVEAFAKMMNTKAKELGCNHTNFVTPNGLDAENHFTTAEDLAKIGSYAIKNDEFLRITNASSHTFKELSKGRTYTVNNKDRFLQLMDGAIGIKTGFTGKAGFCFVGALERDGKKFVSVVLACGWPPNKSYKWHDTKLLMKYGLDYYSLKNITGDTKAISSIPVTDGQDASVNVSYKLSEIKLLLNDKETSRIEYDIPNSLEAPIKKDAVVGHITYYVNEQPYKKIPVYATDSVKKINFIYCLNKVLSSWFFQ